MVSTFWQDAGDVSRLDVPIDHLEKILQKAKRLQKAMSEAAFGGASWVDAACEFAAALDEHGLRDGWIARKHKWDMKHLATRACFLFWCVASNPATTKDELNEGIATLQDALPKRRRGRYSTMPRRLTPAQLEAYDAVGQAAGNVAEAARRLGKGRKTVEQHYKAALKHLGKLATKKSKTTSLPADRRGQINLHNDRRRNDPSDETDNLQA